MQRATGGVETGASMTLSNRGQGSACGAQNLARFVVRNHAVQAARGAIE